MTKNTNTEVELLQCLKERFLTHMHRHPQLTWEAVEAHLTARPDTMQRLQAMEDSGGEPDVLAVPEREESGQGGYLFCDFCPISPKQRVGLCYDEAAWQSRKANKPAGSAAGWAAERGLELMTEELYLRLQAVEAVDEKQSVWLQTPDEIRRLGGALFGDRRYGRVFIYHNGAESYYSSRGFRCCFVG
ncbi:MAG: DUF4256 domain-containing protein [Eubacteriales bacterium]|nr:DUF4256 domain-containing protein [Eubacteriales bacterium]